MYSRLIHSLKGLLFSVTVLAAVAIGQQNSEDQVKSLFLYNFANFVEWPDSAFSKADSPLHLCLYGEAEFAAFMMFLDETMIGDRILRITHTSNIEVIEAGCHVLFVDYDKSQELQDLFQRIEYQYVLSMGEQSDFLDQGGIVHVMKTKERFSFDIDISSALKNGLFIDSDLLNLAREVKYHTSQ